MKHKHARERKTEAGANAVVPVVLVEFSPQSYRMLKQLVETGLYGSCTEVAVQRIVDRFLWDFVDKPVFKL